MSTVQFARRNSVSACIRSTILAAAAMAGFAGAIPVFAAEAPALNEKFTDLGPAIKLLRSEVGQDRRDIVAAAMLLTPSEQTIFWPLYDQYRAEQHKWVVL